MVFIFSMASSKLDRTKQTVSQTKEKVLKKISKPVYDEMIKYVQDKNPDFWGLTKGHKDFIKDMFILSLYKDLYCIGYQKGLGSVFSNLEAI